MMSKMLFKNYTTALKALNNEQQAKKLSRVYKQITFLPKINNNYNVPYFLIRLMINNGTIDHKHVIKINETKYTTNNGVCPINFTQKFECNYDRCFSLD